MNIMCCGAALLVMLCGCHIPSQDSTGLTPECINALRSEGRFRDAAAGLRALLLRTPNDWELHIAYQDTRIVLGEPGLLAEYEEQHTSSRSLLSAFLYARLIPSPDIRARVLTETLGRESLVPVQYWLELGRAREQTGELEEALKAFKGATESAPTALDGHLESLRLMRTLLMEQEARQYADKYPPQLAEQIRVFAHIFMDEPELASKRLEPQPPWHAHEEWYWIAQVLCAADRRDASAVLRLSENMRKRIRDSAWAFRTEGLSRVRHFDDPGGVSLVARAALLKPLDANTQLALAECYVAMGAMDEARDVIESVLSRNPRLSAAYTLLAAMLPEYHPDIPSLVLRATGITRTDPVLWEQLQVVFERRGESGRADVTQEQARGIKLVRSSQAVVCNRVTRAEVLARTQEAVLVLSALGHCDDGDAIRAYELLWEASYCDSLGALGRKLLATLAAALSEHSVEAECHLALAQHYVAEGRRPIAVDSYRAAARAFVEGGRIDAAMRSLAEGAALVGKDSNHGAKLERYVSRLQSGHVLPSAPRLAVSFRYRPGPSCLGVAALAVLEYLRIPVDEGSIAALQTAHGTSLCSLERLLRERDDLAVIAFMGDIDVLTAMVRAGLPVIAAVDDIPPDHVFNHAVVVTGFDAQAEEFLVSDPEPLSSIRAIPFLSASSLYCLVLASRSQVACIRELVTDELLADHIHIAYCTPGKDGSLAAEVAITRGRAERKETAVAQRVELGVYEQSGRWEEARDLAGKLVSSPTVTAVDHYRLGLALSHIGDMTGALREWRSALLLRPRFGHPRVAITAVVTRSPERAPELLDLAEQMIKINALVPDPYLWKGIELAGSAPSDYSIAWLDTAKVLGAGPIVDWYRAHVLHAIGKVSAGIDSLLEYRRTVVEDEAKAHVDALLQRWKDEAGYESGQPISRISRPTGSLDTP